MEKLKRNVILLLIIYTLGILIRGISFNLWETELNYAYHIGKYIGNGLMLISIVWSIVNGIYLFRTKELSSKKKLIWITLDLIPLILLFFGLIISLI